MVMVRNENGTVTMGPLDAMFILQHAETRRFHVCLMEECSMPGPVPDVADTKVVRLKSKMHHTTGSDSFEGALEQLKELRHKVEIHDSNVLLDRPIGWDGAIGFVLVLPNWRVASDSTIGDGTIGGVLPRQEAHTETMASP